jgi:TetR/AcrR family transcriptional regulator
MEEQALEPADRVKLVRQRDRFERGLRALVKEGIEDGSVVPCDPKLTIFVILGAMNWVAKWFKPSGPWKPEQITLALSQVFERTISSSPAVVLPRDVGELPIHPSPSAASPPSLARRMAVAPVSPRAAPKQKKRAGGRS